MLSRTIATVAVLGLLITACVQGSSPTAPDGTRQDATPDSTYTPQSTYAPLATGTPYPTPTALPTPTPYPAAPTLTPQSTYAPLATGTPYPTPTALPTPTPYPAAPTLTPQSTYAPLATGTPYPTPTALPTPTPYPIEPTYTPQPRYTPIPTYTPYPTPTPQPTPTPFPTLRPTPTPTPAPLLSGPHDTQNTRWLTRNYPDIARQIQAFPWVQDGLSGFEAKAIDELLYIGVGKIDNLQMVIRLPWIQDAISDTEYDVLYWLRALNYYDTDVVSEAITMPFLASPDATDALAIRAMFRLATKGVLSALIDAALFQNGIDDGETTLIAAAGTFYNDAAAVRRVLTPGNAAVEAVSIETELTSELEVSIVRTSSQSRPGTVEAIRDAVEFAEGIMGLPLPVEHVVVVFDEDAVLADYTGTNYGFAFGYSPEYETRQDTYEWRQLQAGFVHEVAHYYWRGNADWIDEGVANTFEYVYGIENGLSRGQLKTKRKNCEAHDLEMLTMWDPAKNNSAFLCNYYLGELLFLELLETLGSLEFAAKLQEIYQVALPVQEAGDTPGIAEVRQVFAEQQAIVDKHWSGALNAPENRPFDEGVDRLSHDLIQWDQHPTHDGRSVTFSGTLLDVAVLSQPTIGHARSGGRQNFILRDANGYEYMGSILPPLTDGSRWILDEGDSIADRYSLDAAAKSFTITFPFPEDLETPSDYVVVVRGFQDASQTPRIGEHIDTLGYARIRVR